MNEPGIPISMLPGAGVFSSNQGMQIGMNPAMNFDMTNMGMFGNVDSNPYIFSFGLNQMGFQNQIGNPLA
jgi:hypothetical protein